LDQKRLKISELPNAKKKKSVLQYAWRNIMDENYDEGIEDY
jgi:hypothetical protein